MTDHQAADKLSGQTTEDCFTLSLPCPAPLPEAIEAGIFQDFHDASLGITSEQAQSITEEHAYELLSFLLDSHWQERCARTGQSPDSGRLPKSEDKREANRTRAEAKLGHLRTSYDNALLVYEEAFGAEAAEELHLAVTAVASDYLSSEPEPVQKSLF